MHGTVLKVRGGDRQRNRDKDTQRERDRQTDRQSSHPQAGTRMVKHRWVGGGGGGRGGSSEKLYKSK